MKLMGLLLVMAVAAAGCVMMDTGDSGSWDDDFERDTARWEKPSSAPPAERTGNVVIQVEKVLVDRQEQVHFGSAWRLVDDHVVVSGGGMARTNGIRIGVGGGDFWAAFQAAMNKTRKKEVQKLQIVTLSGTSASISAGDSVYMEVFRLRTPRGQRVVFERTFVGSSMVVQPTVLPGDKVRVKLYPRFTARKGRTINLTELTTEVIARHGQPLVIGGLDESSDNAAYALFSMTRDRQARRMTMILTPYIQGAP